MDENTNTTQELDKWETQLLAKAAGAHEESEDSGEEEMEGDVTKYLLMKEALVQISHISDVCHHAQQPQLIENSS